MLRDARVLVTGASSGIGYAMARALATAGARLVVSGRRRDRLGALADTIAAAGDHRPVVVVADLSVRGAAAELAAQATAALGGIDVLVNNAAEEGSGTYAVSGDDDPARTLFETNYFSPMALVRALLPDMQARRTGAIVNVSSLGAITPIPGTGHYPSTKAALAAATEALRAELAGSGVHLLLVFPGLVETPMLAAFRARPELSPRARTSLRLMPVGTADGLARRIVAALRRRRALVVYPRAYALAPHFPSVSRGVTGRLFPFPRRPVAGGAWRRRTCQLMACR
jgi:short-subunit dehydrogenase